MSPRPRGPTATIRPTAAPSAQHSHRRGRALMEGIGTQGGTGARKDAPLGSLEVITPPAVCGKTVS